MAYSRVSQGSDLYIFRAKIWEIHVASHRDNASFPRRNMTVEEVEKWNEEHRIPIGLSQDGAVLVAHTIQKLQDIVTRLKEEGYRVNSHALRRIHKEIEEENHIHWKRHLELKYVEVFNEYGCYFHGNLVVVNTQKAWESHPRHGVFNSHSCCDVADEAARMVKEKHPEAEMLLSLPTVVMRISVDTNDDKIPCKGCKSDKTKWNDLDKVKRYCEDCGRIWEVKECSTS